MSDDTEDRIVRLSDLRAMESSLENRITERVTERVIERVSELIREEGEVTRRHFDVVAERMESQVKLVAGVNSHHAIVLDDHEQRLQKLERRI